MTRQAKIRKIGEFVLKILGVFVILEPIWMLLPFAGFLYGSVLRIETLSRHPFTAWLTHFVFPVLAIGLWGPVLALVGFLVFLSGAAQIYTARIRRSGLVTKGLYRFVRHPQYIALTLFGAGILLTWGRAIAWIGFFAMMTLYYWLARSEEARCRRRFGKEYEAYRDRTSFVLPGDRHLRGIGSRLGLSRWPLSLRASSGLLLAGVLCFGSMALVDAVKGASRSVPFLTAEVPLTPAGSVTGVLVSGTSNGIPYVRSGRLVFVRGPYRTAAAPGFAELALPRLRRSEALSEFLSFLDERGTDLAIAFGIPAQAPTGGGPPAASGPGTGDGRGPPPDPSGPDRVRTLIFRVHPAPEATLADALTDPAKRSLAGAAIATIDLDTPAGQDVVDGPVFRPGPVFPARSRWRELVTRTRTTAANAPSLATRPGTASSTELVMVKAPILRTRIDPGFARLLLARLAASKRFRRRIERMGTGRDVVPVAFPRPGPNWYRDYGGRPEVSFFVMLVRKRSPGAGAATLFLKDRRTLIGAFVAEMDLAIPAPADPVTRIEVLGSGRDLEERFRFFLSGI